MGSVTITTEEYDKMMAESAMYVKLQKTGAITRWCNDDLIRGKYGVDIDKTTYFDIQALADTEIHATIGKELNEGIASRIKAGIQEFERKQRSEIEKEIEKKYSSLYSGWKGVFRVLFNKKVK